MCWVSAVMGSMIVLVSGGPTIAQDGQPGKQVASQATVHDAKGKEVTVRFWLYLPGDYQSTQKFPMVLFLHGAGERGDNLEAVTKWGPPKMVAEGKQFPFILVSPQCPAGQWWNVDVLAQLIDQLANTYAVDRQRIYVTGLSMGGFGTWTILAKYPHLFAAAVPICGGGDPATVETFKHIPVWAFHGDQDPVVPLRRTEEMVDALRKAGGTVRLTVYPGVGHNSWSATYDNPEVYEWLLAQRRANP